MYQQKLLLTFMLSLSGFLYGAASSSESTASNDSDVQFCDCFSRETVLMPGEVRFYQHILAAQPAGTRDKLVFCVGTVASPDAQMTLAMSSRICAFLSASLGRKHIYEEAAEVDRAMGACIREVASDFPALLTVLEDFNKPRLERRRIAGGS